jgi:pyruvate/2-oxoglutarate dehydrogenase complex dihydrolipoamide acyltransferase (E2) component
MLRTPRKERSLSMSDPFEPDLDSPSSVPDRLHPDEPSGETLSPAVRRLVKLYGLDAGKIPGTGPGGRLRVSDVMAVLGSSANSLPDELPSDPPERSETRRKDPVAPVAPAVTAETPTTSIFECDMSAVLRHRKRMLAEKTELLLTSYYLVAAARALRSIPEICGHAAAIRIAVALTAPGNRTVMPVVQHADLLDLVHANRALRDAHSRLLSGHAPDDSNDAFPLFHHGLTGSILATPTPLPAASLASLGVGRIRRQIAVSNVSGESGPRVVPMALVSLSFRPSQLDIHRANEFLAVFVRQLERWHDDAEPAA